MERQAARWAGLADAVLAEAGRHGLHRSGRRRRCYDVGRVDDALLLPVVRGALPPDDPPSEATRKAVFGSCVATCRRPLCTRCSVRNYDWLVRQRGWTAEQYEQWYVDTVAAALLKVR